jgi:hypothetical protein
LTVYLPDPNTATGAAMLICPGSGYAVRADSILLKFGWLKDCPTSETVGTSKNQYVLEYKFGLWDTEVYDFAS